MSSRSNRTMPVKDIATGIWAMLLLLPLVSLTNRAAVFPLEVWILLHAFAAPFMILDGPGPERLLARMHGSSGVAGILRFLRWSTGPGTLAWSMLQVAGNAAMIGLLHVLQSRNEAAVAALPVWTTWSTACICIYAFAVGGTLLGQRLAQSADVSSWQWNAGTITGCSFLTGTILAIMAVSTEIFTPLAGISPEHLQKLLIMTTAAGVTMTLVMLILNHGWFSKSWTMFRAAPPGGVQKFPVPETSQGSGRTGEFRPRT